MQPLLQRLKIPGHEPFPEYHLSYTQWGQNAADNAVCVHGLTRNSRDFDFVAQALADRYRVFCPDMPGRGGSDCLPPAFYNYAVYVANCQYFLESLKLSSVHWVGTSMGGIIGMMLAGMAPGKLKSLVLNDVGCVVSAKGLSRIVSYAGGIPEFNSRADAEMVLRKNCQPFGITEEAHWQHMLKYSILDMDGGRARFHYDPAIMSGFSGQDIKDVNLWHLWEPVTRIPVLLIRGAQSDILTRETALEMKEKHPRLTLYEVENTGHAPALMADKQTAFIRDWINAV